MIFVTVHGIRFDEGRITLSGEEISITIKGHAQCGKKGFDIVCAGVSALSQSAVLALDYYSITHTGMQQPGFLAVDVTLAQLTETQKIQCESILSVLLIGLIEMHNMYKDFITIQCI